MVESTDLIINSDVRTMFWSDLNQGRKVHIRYIVDNLNDVIHVHYVNVSVLIKFLQKTVFLP